MTKIQWTDSTWNPVTGCTKVSPGCKNCYAETIANRFWGEREFMDVKCHADRVGQPLRWKKPSMVFVNSMSDLFHEKIPVSFVEEILGTINRCPQHIFQVLTKRPQNFQKYIYDDYEDNHCRILGGGDALPNLWLGVSVENQTTADERIPILLTTPATVRFVSIEPILEKITIDRYAKDLDWVIVGGESGYNARPCKVDWIRNIKYQCQTWNCPIFIKQLGSNPISIDFKLKSSKGDNINEFPDDLRVREYPKGRK